MASNPSIIHDLRHAHLDGLAQEVSTFDIVTQGAIWLEADGTVVLSVHGVGSAVRFASIEALVDALSETDLEAFNWDPDAHGDTRVITYHHLRDGGEALTPADRIAEHNGRPEHQHRTGRPCPACIEEPPDDGSPCWNCGLIACSGCDGTEAIEQERREGIAR